MSEHNKFADTFRQEAEELLAAVEESVLDMEQNPEDQDAINRLFRAMHTIKGSGSMFGFEAVASFTHHVETALDLVRNGAAPVSQELIDLILASRDQIKAMLDGQDVDPDRNQQIVAALEALVSGTSPDAPAAAPTQAAQPASRSVRMNKKQLASWRIRFAPEASIFASGTDPVLLLDELSELGECHYTAYTDRIPDLGQLDPEACYMYWDIILTSDNPKEAIQDVFIFVQGNSEIRIEQISTPTIAHTIEDNELPRLGEILVARGDASESDIEEALNQHSKLGEILVNKGKITPDKIQSALQEQNLVRQQKQTESTGYVKVSSDKLDHLINLVGELVITQAQLTEISENSDQPELAKPVEEVERLTAELRDSVLNIRMMPIGSTFNRFRRLVRDLSKELGKEIELTTEGAETELDKTVIERLGDPLVHLIRNSIDHGIESPDTRRQAGKNPAGTIRLIAAHRGANVVISIKDDGKGLDRQKLLSRAIEKGLIAPDAELTRKETFNLIFMPGFSTAEAVTSVSGRGVGMDVVKREIEALRGAIDIESEPGQGTTITLSLPLTLAIIDGLLVEVGPDRYVVPVSMIEECVEMSSQYRALNGERNLMRVRGELVPYIRLREVFQVWSKPSEVEETVIVNFNDSRLGLVVDHIIGDHQTVIKSLGKIYQDVEGVSAATIMGDGSVALILDVAGLVRCAEQEERALVTR